jgi:hypothetical protein
MNQIIEITKNLIVGLFSFIVAACVFMAFALAFCMLLEIFTGRDVIRKDIRPYFQNKIEALNAK